MEASASEHARIYQAARDQTIIELPPHALRPVARSAYLDQVEQIFPWELVGREAELAELAAFCLGEDGVCAWWQAPAWAGKSALMASFALCPPPGVRVVTFFVTARYAGQSDRTAFLEVLLEQLAQLAGQPMPDLLTESTRQGWFARLLKDAAAVCARTGDRLVLLVDGLDEDRGVTAGPDIHSIAALLPAVPPPGVRVVVSGRPDPPLPADVPHRHPLRNPRVVRRLAPSPHALLVREDAEWELAHLLHSPGLGRDLLSLVAAAGGGLSSRDLAELTGRSEWELGAVLRAVSGRTFSGRERAWSSAPGPRVFVLAHEEIQQTATACLGPAELADFRNRLHLWGDGYRNDGWPADTPEYLLRGYARLAQETGDRLRMVALATDWARLDRMLDVSAGDAAALAEIAIAQEIIARDDPPDLTALLQLAVTRDRLLDRNSHIPADLPAAWVGLGNPTRAEALAGSIASPVTRVRALASMAKALAAVGDVEWSHRIVDLAETNALAITDSLGQVSALAGLMEAVRGDLDQTRRIAVLAEESARSIDFPYHRAWALADLVKSLVMVDDRDRAGRLARETETIAEAITDPQWRAHTLIRTVEALAAADDRGQMFPSVRRAETAVRTLPGTGRQASMLVSLVRALAKAGEPDQARRLADRAGTVIGAVPDPDRRAELMTELAEAQTQALAVTVKALSSAGQFDHAETTASTITDSLLRADALAGLVEALAAAARFDRAEAIAESIAEPRPRAQALTMLAQALTAEGDADVDDIDRARRLAHRAETVIDTIPDPREQIELQTGLVRILTATKDLERARGLAHRIEATARTLRALETETLTGLVAALAIAGDREQAREAAELAEAAIGSLTPRFWDQALAGLAQALTEAGELGRAETTARAITDPEKRDDALTSLVAALAAEGELDQAEAIAAAITGGCDRVAALARLTGAQSAQGDLAHARLLLDQAETTAHAILDPYALARARVNLVAALVAVNQLDRAQNMALTITDPAAEARAWLKLATASASAGDPGRARLLIDRAEGIIHTIPDQDTAGWVSLYLVQTLAEAGEHDRAIRSAQAITEQFYRIQAQVFVGDLDGAEAEARAIAAPSLQASALKTIIGASPAPRARRLLALALTRTRHTEILAALAEVDPEAVLTAATIHDA